MKLHDYFAGLLAETVNLKAYKLDLLDQRVDVIVRTFQDDPEIGHLYLEHIPQGSWPHETIIDPCGDHDEFDADFLLLLKEVPEWDPQDYLRHTRAVYQRSRHHADVRKKNRCVRIGYANSCHVDVVPHLRLADGRQVIVDYKKNSYEDTNPQGFTDWMHEKDQLANRHLRRVLRLLKYLRDYKNTFSIPSVILTTLVGNRVQAWDADRLYPDLPTALVTLLNDLDVWLRLHPTMPPIADPSCPGTYFEHRWEEDRYQNFAKWISYYAAKATRAIDPDLDRDASVELWREIFGDAFRKPAATVTASAEVARITKATAPMSRAPQEQFIEEQGYALRPTYDARIEATVRDMDGFRAGTPLRRIRHTVKWKTLDFRLATDCPGPYELFWKVRNNGQEANSNGDLRGQIFPDEGRRRHAEKTRYRGTHYVEAYLVKDGAVVATAHHDVRIT